LTPGTSGKDFDALARRYTTYVPWERRLAREIPFLEKQLLEIDAHRVLDCACGPGRHAVALAKKGLEVTGLDTSPEMLGLAEAHAREQNTNVRFVEGRFETLSEAVEDGFDAVLCLGNSLSAAEDLEAVQSAMPQFAAVLRPGGVIITQTVDFSVAAPGPVTSDAVRSAEVDGSEVLFVKSFVRVGEKIFVHWVTLEQDGEKWDSEVTFHSMTTIEPDRLLELLGSAGFSPVRTYGDYAGNAFVRGVSRDLIAVGTKSARER
jgi:ubiquinone/menaquinone biosynthesis C-methylase UbiE